MARICWDSIEQEILEWFREMTPREQEMLLAYAKALNELRGKVTFKGSTTEREYERFMSLAADATEDDFKGLWIKVLTMKGDD